MEILVVFFLGYLLTKLQGSTRWGGSVKVGAVVVTVLLYAVGKVVWTVREMPETLYEATGLSRNTRCDEVRSLYRSLAKEKHPDRNLGSDSSEEFISLQQSFDTLGSPTLRIRYELYGRTEEDAMMKDLVSHAGFYLQGLLLAYSLTCNKVLPSAEYGESGDVRVGRFGDFLKFGVDVEKSAAGYAAIWLSALSVV